MRAGHRPEEAQPGAESDVSSENGDVGQQLVQWQPGARQGEGRLLEFLDRAQPRCSDILS